MKRYRDVAVDQVGLLLASTPAIIAPTVARPRVERGQ
jgi:hypothetical protein